MATQTAGVAAEYGVGLADYLKLRSESQLTEAARLGRLAMADNLGVLDMIMIHHAALAEALRPGPPESLPETLSSAALFLCEALGAYEMAHRGFKDASEAVMRMMQFDLIVCHELRTPLTSIVTSMGMLQDILNAGPESSEGRLISNAVKSAGILKTRTADLQDLVSYRAGILSLKPSVVEVDALLKNLAGRLEPQATRAGMEIRLDIADGLPKLIADPNRLEQVVSNLISNALKYASEGRRVDLRALTRNGHLTIEVQDYGPGINAEARLKIFQPNYHRSNDTEEVTGMGIGLALCRELVEQHGGKIIVLTEEGKGSLFTIELPLSKRRGET